MFENMFPTSRDFVEETTDDMRIFGDVAFGTGTYQVTTTGEAEQRVTGDWLAVFVRQADGTWQIARHMSIPRTAPAP